MGPGIVMIRLLKALRAEARRGKCYFIGQPDIRTFKGVP